MKKNCANCYFCTRVDLIQNGQEHTFSVSEDERKKLCKGDFSFIDSQNTRYMQCYKGQWSEALNGTDIKKMRSSLKYRKCLFFYPYTKGNGKFLNAVDRETEERVKLDSRKIAHWAFFFSAISIIISFFSNIEKIQQYFRNLLNN